MIALILLLSCAPVPTDGSDPRVTRSFQSNVGYYVEGVGVFQRFEPEPGIVCYTSGTPGMHGSLSCVVVPLEAK